MMIDVHVNVIGIIILSFARGEFIISILGSINFGSLDKRSGITFGRVNFGFLKGFRVICKSFGVSFGSHRRCGSDESVSGFVTGSNGNFGFLARNVVRFGSFKAISFGLKSFAFLLE